MDGKHMFWLQLLEGHMRHCHYFVSVIVSETTRPFGTKFGSCSFDGSLQGVLLIGNLLQEQQVPKEPKRLSLLLYLNRLFFIQHFPLCSIYNIVRYVYANRFVYDLLYRKYYGDILIFFPLEIMILNPICMLFFFTWNSFEISCVPTMIDSSSCRFKNMRGPKEPTSNIFILSPILTRLLSFAFL